MGIGGSVRPSRAPVPHRVTAAQYGASTTQTPRARSGPISEVLPGPSIAPLSSVHSWRGVSARMVLGPRPARGAKSLLWRNSRSRTWRGAKHGASSEHVWSPQLVRSRSLLDGLSVSAERDPRSPVVSSVCANEAAKHSRPPAHAARLTFDRRGLGARSPARD